MAFEFGDIVLVAFPFTNQVTTKRRPAVIVSNAAYNLARLDVVVMAVTSQLRPAPTPGEVWISHHRTAPCHPFARKTQICGSGVAQIGNSGDNRVAIVGGYTGDLN